MLKVVNEYAGKIHYFIQTDAQGNIDVYKKHGRGKNHIQHLNLPLEKLWQKKNSTPQREHQRVKFNVDYPILLRGERSGKLVLCAADGEIFQCTVERSVLRLFDSSNHTKRGWDLVCRDLPYRTDICEIGKTESGEYILLLFNANDRETILFNLQTGEKHALFFNHWKSPMVPSFIFDSGKFFHYNSNGQWSISPHGKVEVVENIDRNKFLQHRTAVSEIGLKYTSNYGTFKNINKVYINELGEFVLNVHALKLVGNGRDLKLVQTDNHHVKFAATVTDEHVFTFDDGSSVEVNRNGLIILRSSDRILPAIYIPTTLDASLGIATSTEFAGNEYYFKEQTYSVVLKDHGRKQSDLMKVMEDLMRLSFQEASELLARAAPVTLMSFCPKQKALDLQNALVKAGATVELKLPEGEMETEIKMIPVSLFFNKHIMRFINTIVNYGATNNRKR
jgi:ribosomal protein L7/L12